MSDNLLNAIVQGTLYTLLAFSVLSWILIVSKSVQAWRVTVQDRCFIRKFWTSPDLDVAANVVDDASPKGRVAHAGFDALRGGASSSDIAADLEHSWDRQELLERHLRQQIQRERHALESGLAILASVGSTAPFVGLFGTVFGIIHALAAIGSSGGATIDVVAGPIGEALIATGVGIAVAVPAVLAYNFFLRRLKVVTGELDSYATDLITLAQKRGFRLASAPLASPVDVSAKSPAARQEAYA